MAKAKAPQYKIVLIGDCEVGKTALVLRYVNDSYDPTIQSTIGVAFRAKTVCLKDGTKVQLHIWDTAGQEQFDAVVPLYYRQAHAALIVYDLTKTKSFEKAKFWLNEIRRNANDRTIIAIVGNKSDLKPQRGEVETKLAKDFAAKEGIHFIETSAKTGENVIELFTEIAEELPAAVRLNEADVKKILDEERKNRKNEKNSKFCC